MIVEWLAFSVALMSLVLTVWAIFLNSKTQKKMLLHDIASRRLEALSKRAGEGDKAYEERVVNFYEYLALLVIKKEISEGATKDLFLDDFKNLFKFHKEIISKNDCWDYIHRLAKKWKIEDMEEQKLTRKKKDNISIKLEEIYESVQLGTIDNVILGLMFFTVAFGLSVLSLGIPKLLINRPHILVGTLILLISIVPLIAYIYVYARAIFFKKNSFSNRLLVVSYLGGTVSFILFIWIFLIVAWIYETSQGEISPMFTTTLTIVLFVISALYGAFWVRPRVWQYFDENYSHLLKRRKIELGIKEKD